MKPCIGASTYALLRDLVALDSPGTLTFRRLSKVLTAHFKQFRVTVRGVAPRSVCVCGVQHEGTQWRLLEIAKAMETADTNTKSFNVSEPAIRKENRQIPPFGRLTALPQL